jgi:hypothetical protein
MGKISFLRTCARPLRLPGLVAAGLGLTLTVTGAGLPSPHQAQIADFRVLLSGVSADSAGDAWAVGTPSTSGRVKAIHWNGTSWAKTAVPDVPGLRLAGVSALAPDDAWAVGNAAAATGGFRSLVLHWDGTSWTQVPSPRPHLRLLTGVSADSSSDAWAVGSAQTATGGDRNLVLHWDGTRWTGVPAPSPSASSLPELDHVSADSPSDAWAVGTYSPSKRRGASLALHWNGASWRRVLIPTPSGATINSLSSVTALSPSDAWAVGSYIGGGTQKAQVLHWDGASWQESPIPSPGSDSALSGVSAVSADDVWAVGSSASGNLVLHWNGTKWATVASPNLQNAFLTSVSGVSGSDAWAAGCVCVERSPARTVLLHWDGTRWTRS